MPRKKKNEDILAPLDTKSSPTDMDSIPQQIALVEPHRSYGQVCDTCIVFDKCPNYAAGASCSINFSALFTALGRSPEALKESALSVLELQYERIQRALFQEKMNAGVIDPNLSAEITRYFELLWEFKRLHEKTSTLSIRAEGESAGILGKLLLSGSAPNK